MKPGPGRMSSFRRRDPFKVSFVLMRGRSEDMDRVQLHPTGILTTCPDVSENGNQDMPV